MKANQTNPVRTSLFRVRCWMLNVAVLAMAASALADVHYVDVNSTNATPPYSSWSTAARNIQDAVDAAVAGDEIVVTNGTYAIGGRDGNRVTVDKPLTLRSVNGSQFTTIDAGYDGRCVYLTNDAALFGFTLTNGVATYGGGVLCESRTAVVSNCVLSGNVAKGAAGGGAYGGTLNNCTLTGNSAEAPLGYETRRGFPPGFYAGDASGGGAAVCTLNNCILTGNLARAPFNYAAFYGGAYGGHASGGGAAWCVLSNCTLAGNVAQTPFHSVINRGGNWPLPWNPGAYGGGAYQSTLTNCILTNNSAIGYAGSFNSRPVNIYGYGGGALDSMLNNCTVSGNSASTYGGGAYGGTLNNCIVYFNTDAYGANYDSSCTLNYSCTEPLPFNRVGNITNAPLFVDQASGNLRLQSNSPCINAGNNSYVTSATDLDSNPRIIGGTVDMGAYEFQAVRYVDVNNTNPTPPYSSWATAATNIQDAVDAAVAGDEIVVTNGIYATGGRATVSDSTLNRVVVDKLLSIRSVNGSESTIIRGGFNTRCVYLTNGASLTGFTLTRAFLNYSSGGGAWGGTLNNCTLTRNSVWGNGGGALYSTLNNCVLTRNSSGTHFGSTDNTSASGGGAAHCALNNCTLSGNWTTGSRTSDFPGGGGGAYGGELNNCIVYFNSRRSTFMGTDFFTEDNYGGYAAVANCCTTPTTGFPNITNAPLFVDTNGWSNLRLQSNSPCINAGNNYNITSATDLDGNPRIVGGTVDIGAYEFQSPTSIISYAWLQQFNLPIDPATDTADPDGDRLNNWQEWRCATDPTNALSALRLLAPAVVGSDLLVRWESVPDRTYFLERSMDALSAFTPLATGIPGQPGTTTYIHTNAIGAGPWFYRVGVSTP